MKRIIRERRLTPEEIAKDRQIRELIENEKPEISKAIRQRMIEVHKAKSAGQPKAKFAQRLRSAPEQTLKEMLEVVAKEIQNLAIFNRPHPKERTPKEEQVRCAIYHWLQGQGTEFVQVEANYRDVDQGKTIACDIRILEDGAELWMEVKGEPVADDSAAGYIVKPRERLENWKVDIDKLTQAPADSWRAFLLVGLAKAGQNRKNFSPDQFNALERYIKEKFPAAEVFTLRETYPLNAWREIEPAEIVTAVWIWNGTKTTPANT
jgi:hypothetical protein